MFSTEIGRKCTKLTTFQPKSLKISEISVNFCRNLGEFLAEIGCLGSVFRSNSAKIHQNQWKFVDFWTHFQPKMIEILSFLT